MINSYSIKNSYIFNKTLADLSYERIKVIFPCWSKKIKNNQSMLLLWGKLFLGF